jgi:hypothetical protein
MINQTATGEDAADIAEKQVKNNKRVDKVRVA